MFGVLNHIVYAFCIYVVMYDVHATSPSQFMDDIIGYRSACRSIGWEPKQDCVAAYNVIAFHANLKTSLTNLTVGSAVKFENVQLNKENGYDPKTGVFTAPEDGVFSFAWSILTKTGSTVYIAAVVDDVNHAFTCIDNQKSKWNNSSGHLLYELKKGNKVWIKIFQTLTNYLHGGFYTYFSGSKIISI